MSTEPWLGLLGAPGSPRAWWFFELGFRPWFRRQLSAIHVGGVEAAARALEGAGPAAPGTGRPLEPARAPLLLVANHTSWYDGFLLREVHRRLRPAAPLRFVMLRSELARSRTLRWIGGTGFDPAHPATLRGALAELAALGSQGVTVAYFPQGKIYPSTRRPLGFLPGVELAIRRLAPLTVLPVALHLEPGRHLRPAAWIQVGTPQGIPAGEAGAKGATWAPKLEAQVAALLDRVQAHLHDRGEDAPPLPEDASAPPPIIPPGGTGRWERDPAEAPGGRPPARGSSLRR